MSENTSLFDWHIHVGDKVSSHPTYGIIPVTTEFPRIRAPGQGINQQLYSLTKSLTGLNGKSGLAIFVTMAFTQGESNKSRSITVPGMLYLTVLESRKYNDQQNGFAPDGLGLHADDVAVGLARYLQDWEDGGVADAARAGAIRSDHEAWLPPEVRSQGEKVDMYCTAFPISALMTWDLFDRCYQPKITLSPGTAALTCNTAGVSYLYTLDGSYPCAATNAQTNNGSAINVNSGDIVTAIAKKSGMEDSSVARMRVP